MGKSQYLFKLLNKYIIYSFKINNKIKIKKYIIIRSTNLFYYFIKINKLLINIL